MCRSNDFDKICTYCFAIWNIISGLICTTMSLLAYIDHEHAIHSQYYEVVVCLYCITICICAPLHMLSGILILLGDRKDSKCMFEKGKYLSNLFPVFLLGTIIFPIIHFVGLARVCSYHKSAGSKSKNLRIVSNI